MERQPGPQARAACPHAPGLSWCRGLTFRRACPVEKDCCSGPVPGAWGLLPLFLRCRPCPLWSESGQEQRLCGDNLAGAALG